MDTEFDRQCIKVIVALNYSRSKIECSGQRAETVKKSLEQVSEIIEECKNTQSAAEDFNKYLRGRIGCRPVYRCIAIMKKDTQKF